jgi:hypothetical protein
MHGAAIGTEAARLLADLLPDSIGPGLTGPELAAIEADYGFTFAADHRAFLAAGLPVEGRFPDWRGGGFGLRDQLGWPVDGVLYDVEHNAFWYPAWGPRPHSVAEALAVAGRRLTAAPPMIPVYGHRYLPAGSGPSGCAGHPVLSMYQTDIIVYGRDLVDYVGREFGHVPAPQEDERPHVTVEFWRDLVE